MKWQKITLDKILSPDEIMKLIAVCEKQAGLDLLKGRQTWITRRLLVALSLDSGLRVSEIAALKIKDLHLGTKKIALRVRNSKGGKKRGVHINGPLCNLLKEYLKIKGELWRQPSSPEDYLFSKKEGRPCTPNALHFSFKKALQEAGLPLTHTIHHARHTYAKHLLANTGDLKYVQKQLGHYCPAYTAIYADT